MTTKTLFQRITSGSLVLQIAIGIAAGIAISQVSPPAAASSLFLGDLFVMALKAVAPVLVLVLVASAIANRRASHTAQLRPIIIMYLVGTFAAALLAVSMSMLFPTTLALQLPEAGTGEPNVIIELDSAQ
jgi:serine/threonine transporter